jgi:hypothetical protein
MFEKEDRYPIGEFIGINTKLTIKLLEFLKGPIWRT